MVDLSRNVTTYRFSGKISYRKARFSSKLILQVEVEELYGPREYPPPPPRDTVVQNPGSEEYTKSSQQKVVRSFFQDANEHAMRELRLMGVKL